MIYAVNNVTKEHRVITGEAHEVDDWRNKMQGWHVIQADADGWIAHTTYELPLPDGARCDIKTTCDQHRFDGEKACHAFWSAGSTITHYRPIIDQPASEEPKGWRGPEDGLPPAGVVCEVDYCGEWRVCEVIAQFKQRAGMVAAFTVELKGGVKVLGSFGEELFRPLPTPREQWVDEAMKAADCEDSAPLIRSYFEAIYDAGLAKLPEQTK